MKPSVWQVGRALLAVPSPLVRPSRRWLLLLALGYTLLNAPKPLLVDDAAYYYFAQQFARDPLRPYGFQMFWYQVPQPANEVLAPPVLPFWWSLGLRLFGETPWLWKLWLFPFAFLFVWGLDGLVRRFARGMAKPIVCLTVFSPSFLPSFNLMLDVPATALGLTALNLFLRAFGRKSLVGAGLAGVVAGCAMQTKYTAFMVPAVMLLYLTLFSWSGRRVLITVVAVAVALAIFVGWESFVAVQHGQSHFLANQPEYPDWAKWWEAKQRLAIALLPLLGGLAPALALLGLTACRCPRLEVALVGLLMALAYLAVALVPLPPLQVSRDFWLFWPLEQLTFGTSGLLLCATLLGTAAVLCFGRQGLTTPGSAYLSHRSAWFLTLWLLGEIAAYFLLSTFPAARRTMGLVLVATLLVGRLASRSCRLARRRQTVNAVVLSGVSLGSLYYAVDLVDAFTAKNAVEAAAQGIAELSASEARPATIWYVGHWGFQYYAERAGMKPVVPGASRLHEGDWLVVPLAPNNHIERQEIEIDPAFAFPVQVIPEDRVSLPWRTVMCYYGGYVPLQHHSGPRLEVTIYRVKGPWLVRSAP